MSYLSHSDQLSSLPPNYTPRHRISACGACLVTGKPSVVAWISHGVKADSVTVIPGLGQELTTFGVWSDYCVECIESGKVEVESIDHPQNFGYGSDWSAYKSAGYGTQVGIIIATMRREWESKFGGNR